MIMARPAGPLAGRTSSVTHCQGAQYARPAKLSRHFDLLPRLRLIPSQLAPLSSPISSQRQCCSVRYPVSSSALSKYRGTNVRFGRDYQRAIHKTVLPGSYIALIARVSCKHHKIYHSEIDLLSREFSFFLSLSPMEQRLRRAREMVISKAETAFSPNPKNRGTPNVTESATRLKLLFRRRQGLA